MTRCSFRTAPAAALFAAALLTSGCSLFVEDDPEATVQEELEAFAEQLEGYHEQEGSYPEDGEAVVEFVSALEPWPITSHAYAQDPGQGLGNGRESNFLYCLPGEANGGEYAAVAVAASGEAYAVTPDGVASVELENPEHAADICADAGAPLATENVDNDHRYWIYPQGSWRSWVDLQDQQDQQDG